MNVGILCFVAAASISSILADCPLKVPPNLPVSERRIAYERSIRQCPNEVHLYVEFTSLLIANREFNTALPWIEKGLKLAPDDSVLNLRKGEALVGLSQGKEALTALAKAPETGEAEFFRGLAYQLVADHRASQTCFLRAWEQGDEDPYVLYSVMVEDKELGDKASGIDHFKIMLARFPDSAWIHILLGDAHFQKSEEAEARSEYLAAVQQMPDLFEPNFRLAYLAFEAGENHSAIEYYRRALAAKPRHTEANIYLGEALRRDGRLPEAINQLRRAIQLDAKSELAYDSLAKCLSDAGRLPEAANTLAAAEKQFPDESKFPAMLARVLSRLGRTAEASRAAARAAQIIDQKNKKVAVVPPQ